MHSPWVFGNQRKVLLWGNDISSTWVLLEMYILVSQAPAVEAQVIPTMLTIWETWMWRTLDLKSVDSVALTACVWCPKSGEMSKAQCYRDFSPERKEASRGRTTRHPTPPPAASYWCGTGSHGREKRTRGASWRKMVMLWAGEWMF